MPALKPITIGSVFSRLTVIRSLSKQIYECRCECGIIGFFRKKDLRSGNTRSCGCLVLDRVRECNTKHGHAPRKGVSSEYGAWARMLSRVLNQKSQDWKDYGGRGITVSEEWLEFPKFLADMGPRPKGTSLNRMDNDGPYSKENCKWSTPKEQARNRRSGLYVTIGGNKRLLIDCADEAGLPYTTVFARLQRGWPMSRLFSPLKSSGALPPEVKP